MPLRQFILSFVLVSCCLVPLPAETTGADLYLKYCAVCHGQEGLEVNKSFPPLAESDYLSKEREKALRAPLEGLHGRIQVNGVFYDSWMPPVTIDDESVAKIYNYIFTSWGNNLRPTSAKEITELRSKTAFPTFEALVAESSKDFLPNAPAGWRWTVVAELDFQPTRIVTHPDRDHVVILAANGDVWKWNIETKELKQLFVGSNYLNLKLGTPTALGLNTDKEGRLYIVVNQCNKAKNPVVNEVTIFRTSIYKSTTAWTLPQPWFTTSYNYGIGPFNHGVNHIAQGPDGLLYVSSGSRTDGGEEGKSSRYDKTGEKSITACIWQLDPQAEKPEIKVFAQGLRNTYHFIWDQKGRMLGVDNGPDADAPEELNLIEKGNHYGFPYQFSNWKKNAYPHTPAKPAGLTITLPFANVGPDAGGVAEGLYTFTPHSSPSGLIELDSTWPEPLGGGFVMIRYGNLLKEETGFDLIKLDINFERKELRAKQIASSLGRPISLLALPEHRLMVAEYCRGYNLSMGSDTNGRLLILEPR